MKNLFLTLILMLFNLSFWGLEKATPNIDYNYESTVVLNIKSHTADEIQSAHDLLLKNSAIVIDYQCLASGVIVLKLSHNFTHEADVKSIVYNALNSKVPMKRIAIVFVDIHTKSSQC